MDSNRVVFFLACAALAVISTLVVAIDQQGEDVNHLLADLGTPQHDDTEDSTPATKNPYELLDTTSNPVEEDTTLEAESTTDDATENSTDPSESSSSSSEAPTDPSSEDPTTDSSVDPTTDNPTSTTETLPTGAPGCEDCDFDSPCSSSCGRLLLPAEPQVGSMSSELYAESGTYVKVTLDARVLKPGEMLSLKENSESMRGLAAPTTIITCRSNTSPGGVAFSAWSGALVVKYTHTADSRDKCPETPPSSVARVVEFSSLELPPEGGGNPRGLLKFPIDDNSPAPEEGGEWTWSVEVTEGGGGFGVNISVEYVNLNASLGDFLTINPGLQMDQSQIIMFSWLTTKTREYRFLRRDAFYVRLVLGPRTEGQSMDGIGFRIKYDTHDPVTPPPTTTSTTTPLPTPPGDRSESILVYVGGVTAETFMLRIGEFQEAIAAMANDFCNMSDIALRDPIYANNVRLHEVSRCPGSWPGALYCVSIVLAVPAFTMPPPAQLNASSAEITPRAEEGPYELTALHLKQMWNMLYMENLLPPGMKLYEEPQDVLVWWVVVTLAVLMLFVLLIVLAWRVDLHHQLLRSSKSSMLLGPNSQSPRHSDTWMNGDASPHQVVPPYMVMEGDSNIRRVPDFYSGNDWAYERDSYSVTEGMVNHAFEEEDEEEEELRFRRQDDDYGSEEEIDEDVVPTRPDPTNKNNQWHIYDTPSATNMIQLTGAQDDHLSETVL